MKIALLGILGNTAIFLLFAFACWNINPAYWDSTARVLCVFLMGTVTIFTFAYFVITLDNDKKQ